MDKNFVKKYNVKHTSADYKNPLTVGNGNFAFTCDFTGLQTFYELYDFIPLCTMSDLIWAERNVTSPKPYESFVRASDGREIKYMSDTKSPYYEEYRLNAYKFDLFKLAFNISGKPLDMSCVSDIEQELDLFSGRITSQFLYSGERVKVTTFIPQDKNNLQIEVDSKLKGLEIRLFFLNPSPSLCGGVGEDKNYKVSGNRILRSGKDFEYKLFYTSDMPFFGNSFSAENGGKLTISLDGDFGLGKTLEEYFSKAKAYDIADEEITRRYVQSLYLIKVNSLGKYPPAETGLTCNSWLGKFHLEMHLWHDLGVIRAGLYEYVLPSLKWYLTIMDSMRARAEEQGYKGMRPPKMTSPAGDDSPSNIGCFLIWQIPHIFVMLDEIYKQDENALNFEDFAPILVGFADFLADFWYLKDGEYHLDSPLIPANENVEKFKDTPIFETCYTLYAFRLFGKWCSRLNITYDFKKIDDILSHYVKPTVKDGAYETFVGCDNTYSHYNTDHPMTVGGYSFFKSEVLDKDIVKNSLYKILRSWDYESCWGWDFPMLAMAAENVGERTLAEDILKSSAPKNTYLKNGHNPQLPRKDLPIYLPGNGAFVLAVTEIYEK